MWILLVVVVVVAVSGQGIYDDDDDPNLADSSGTSDEKQCYARNCESCDPLDLWRCAVCSDGFRLDNGTCLPCGYGCKRCNVDSCVQCFEGSMLGVRGYRFVEGECLLCPAGCAACGDRCANCFWHRTLPNCDVSWTRLAFVLAACCCCCCLWRRRREHAAIVWSRRRERAALVVGTGTGPSYPTGKWRGYYAQRGQQHALLEFELRFGEDGVVGGAGVDDVGEFVIRGRHAHSNIFFTKSYELGSLNSEGVRARGNKGHSVDYRARPAETTDLAAGVRGDWIITSVGSSGTFRLWPVLLDDAITTGTSSTGDCVVCFEDTTLTQLRPCGHVAICAPCGQRLPSPKRCPLCRTFITNLALAS
ncbi:hypothetical protein CTAYLR_008275 [Chrysophaeum taylorii]|uniref:RING-type domain-containing protein n=1 Tax=Chrysophaeum taylorii TaxID=2483200 RepID=A0AAD7XH23_9STRA|nr:hypothetical protein CTAYLR_008275 [Chrysophaeum taylorii]